MSIDWNAVWNSVSISAIVQIAILYFVIYAILKYAKGSRFGQVLMGVGLLAAMMIAFTFLFHFDVLSIIVRSLLVYLAISTVISSIMRIMVGSSCPSSSSFRRLASMQ